MSDSDATKDEKKTEEANGELTNDQQVIDLVETENQAEKEQQDDEKVTEVPKVEDGQDTVGENKTSKFSMKFTFSIPILRNQSYLVSRRNFFDFRILYLILLVNDVLVISMHLYVIFLCIHTLLKCFMKDA